MSGYSPEQVDKQWYNYFILSLLSTPMGIDYVEIDFDMEVQPLVTHNAAWPLCSVRKYGVSTVCIDVMSSH